MLKIILFIFIYIYVVFFLFKLRDILKMFLHLHISNKLIKYYTIIVTETLKSIDNDKFDNNNIFLSRSVLSKKESYDVNVNINNFSIEEFTIKTPYEMDLNIAEPEINYENDLSSIYKRILFAKKYIRCIESNDTSIIDKYN